MINGKRMAAPIGDQGVAQRKVGTLTAEKAAEIDAEWGRKLYRSMRAAFRAGIMAHRETCGGRTLGVACTDEAISGWLQQLSEADDKRVQDGGLNDPQFC